MREFLPRVRFIGQTIDWLKLDFFVSDRDCDRLRRKEGLVSFSVDEVAVPFKEVRGDEDFGAEG